MMDSFKFSDKHFINLMLTNFSNKIKLIIAILFVLTTTNSLAQCGFGGTNSLIVVNPTAATQTTANIGAGDYFLMNVVNGGTYTTSTCTNGTFDTQLSLYNNSGGAGVGYNDDTCGLRSVVTFTATFTGQVRVVLNRYDCLSTNGGSADFGVEYSGTVPATSTDLAVTKTVDNITPDEGDSIIYTLTVNNNGPVQATNVSLTDILPAGVTYVSDDGAYVPGTGVWTIGTLNNGSSATLNITATVDAGTLGTTITNTITAINADQTDSDATADDLNESITVTSSTIGLDTDGDGITNDIDLDDDNDGIPDIDENLNCIGSIAPNIFIDEDYGTGNRTSFAFTNYCYENGLGTNPCGAFPGNVNVNDGEYAILQFAAPYNINTGGSSFGSWLTIGDHTGNPNGRMAVFNAALAAGQFYNRPVTGLVPNVNISVNFWALNVLQNGTNGILPNITYEIRDTSNNLIVTGTTGNIPENNVWNNYAFTFNPGANTQLSLILINNAPGGGGNDLAIDDIQLSQLLCDTDSDGIPDQLDLDSDNDGIYDVVESGALNTVGVNDADNDGRIDIGAGSFGANGLYNSIENNDTQAAIINYTVTDSDGDGLRDAVEIDSDNDGCNDVLEAGYTDANNDGVLASLPTVVNSDGLVTGTAVVDGYTNPNDGDSNTIFDFQEASPLVTTHPPNRTVCDGSNTSFAVVATGGGLSYQWQISTNGGGSFSDLSNGGVYSNVTDPTLNITGAVLSMNSYQYRVNISSTAYVCGAISSNAATLTIQVEPDAGTNGTLTICAGDTVTAAQLFAELGGSPDAGGSWTPALAGAGTYTYTVSATAPCTIDDTSEVVVTESNPTVNAGANVNICQLESTTLTATPSGGSGTYTYLWSSGQTTPSITVSPPGNAGADTNYDYTVTITDTNTLCTDSDTVRVRVESNPTATVTMQNPTCNLDNGTITFTFPDHPNRTGIEFSLDGQTSYETNVADNGGSVTYSGLSVGIYDVWVRWGNNECPIDLGSVTLTDAAGIPNAPTSGGNEAYCAGDAIPTLTVSVGAGETADWYDAASGGTLLLSGNTSYTPSGPGTYYAEARNTTLGCLSATRTAVILTEEARPNAGSDGSLNLCASDTATIAQLQTAITGEDAGGVWTPALAPGVTTYTYTVSATAPCVGDDTSEVVVTAQAQPNAGTDGTLTICQGDTVTAAQLFAELGGSPDAGGSWTPALAGAGTYTYTVSATAPCVGDDTSEVVVTAQAQPNAGTDGTLTICQGDTVTAAQLFAELGGSPDAGGSWTPALAGAGTYTYTVSATAPCVGDDTSEVVVTAQAQPNAGTDGTLTICQGDTVTAAQLFAELGGSPDAGGSWTPALAGAGTYTYTVSATAPCVGDDTSEVVVTAQAQPNAGTDGTLTICQGDTVTAAQLFAELGGSPDAGGSWTPALAGAGTYTYTVSATAPCVGDDTSEVVVTAQAQPNAGTDGTLTICQGDTVTAAQLFAELGGSPDAGGSWTPALAGAGTYTYTVSATAPCVGDDTSEVVVTAQAQPNAGTDGTLTICQGDTVTAAQLFAELGGSPDAGGSWTPALAGAGTYTYTVSATAPCVGDDTSEVVVTAQAQPNAGTDGTLTICQGDTVTAAQLFAELGGSPDAGGSWTPALAGAGTYTYTVSATAPCVGDDTSEVVVTAQAQPNAGTDGTLTICQGDTVTAAQLFAELGGSPDAGGSWTPALAGAGTYTYTVSATAPCVGDDTSEVVVTAQAQPNAGTDGTLTICQGDTVTAAQLFAELGGSPDAGGSWTPALAGAGTYTYTVSATAPCVGDDTSEVVVTAQAQPNAGTDGTLTICQGDTVTAAQLFAELGGSPDAGGSWTPALAGAGTYTYTVSATAPCVGDDTSEVVVTAQAQPNAGTDGTLTICQGDTVTAAQLFAELGGSPDAGGSWTPALAGAGTYTYTVSATAPCVGDDTSEVVVTAQAQPNAGTDGTLTICQGDTVTAAQLFAELGGSPDAGGSWTPALAGAGTYTYTVSATAPCVGDDTSEVVVTAQAQPNAGTDGTLTICQGDTVTAAQLFAELGGSPDAGGSWTPALAGAGTYTYTVSATAPCVGDDTSEVVVTAQAQPNAGTDGTLTICQGDTVTAAQLFAELGGSPDAGGSWTPALAGAGTYTYTVSATAPCVGDDTSEVVVTAQAQPNAGTDGTLTICQGDTVTAAQLFAELGGSPDAGGSWTPALAGAGTYTYTVSATAPCVGDDTSEVVVTAQAQPNAGTDGTLTICQGDTVTAAQLFAELGGSPDAGGSWTPALAGAGTYTYTVSATAPCVGDDTSEVVVTAQAQPNAGTDGTLTICQGDTVTAAQLFAELGGSPDAGGSWTPALAGAGTYTYTVSATAPCVGDDTSEVVVTAQAQPNAGTDGTLTICQGDTVTAAQLFAELGGSPDAGGSWTPALAGAGTYTYTVSATAPCVGDDTSEVVVTAQAQPNAGTDGTLTICQGDTVTAAQLFAELGGSPDAGGSWTPALAGAGTYTYTVSATAPCVGDDTSEVVVTAQAQPNAGTDGTLTICQGDTVTAAQLFAELGGSPDAGGSWTPALAGAGTYTYTVSATAPCVGDDTSEVVVTAQAQPNAGTDGTLTICQGDTVTAAQLFAELGGSPDAGGSWTPALAGAGTYTYTVSATAPCVGDDTSEVVVTAQAQPNAGTDGTLTICQGDTVTAAQLFAELGGSPDAGGSWTPALAGAGTYTYTVSATAPCVGDDTSEVVVTAQAQPNAGTDGTLTICQGDTVTAAQLFAELGGSPDAGGSWTPALAGAGTYTYTVSATAPCVGDDTSEVVVTAQAQPNAGTDGTLTICQGDTVTAAQLFAELGGSPDAGGSWTPALAGAGTYTYTVSATAPCVGDDTSEVVVTAQAQPNAGTDGTLTICQGDTVTAAQLFAELGGSPDAGGSWTPALAGAGTYTYTVSATAPCVGDDTSEVVVTAQAPAAPTSGGDQTECEQNPIQTLTATATPPAGSTIVWYDAATGGSVVGSPILNSVGTITYYAESVDASTCVSTTRTPVTLTIQTCISDLSLTKTVDNSTPNVGDVITFTITVLNSGPFDVSGVRVQDTMPVGLINITATPSVGTYNVGTGIWDISAATIVNGATVTLTVSAEISPQCGTIINRAEIISSGFADPDSTPNNGN